MDPDDRKTGKEGPLERVREGELLHFQDIAYRVLSRRRDRELVILELESSDGDRATLIGHPTALQTITQQTDS